MSKTVTRKYEGLFLFGTNYTSQVDDAIKIVRSAVEKAGGKVHVLKKWDDRKLAYEVKKQSRGLYLLSFFEAETSAIATIERELRLGGEMLRCLITDGSHLSADEVEKMEPQKPEPKPELDDEGRPIRSRVGGGVTGGGAGAGTDNDSDDIEDDSDDESNDDE